MLLDLVTQSCQTLCDPMDYSLPGSFVHGDSPGKNTRVGCQALLGDLPNTGIEPRSPELQADSFFFFLNYLFELEVNYFKILWFLPYCLYASDLLCHFFSVIFLKHV